VKIAILSAMEEEIAPLLSYLTEEQGSEITEIEHAGNTYYESKYHDLDLVLAYSKIGKVHAAISATVMLDKFDCDQMLFTGVAGGINPDLKIGDLVMATHSCQHDVDITAFGHEPGFIPGSKTFIETCPTLQAVAEGIAEKHKLKVIKGCIATGDQFIHSAEKKDYIATQFKADAIEMEGSAVATVCELFSTPLFLLRSISDTADMDASFNFEDFLDTATKNSAAFIIKMLDEINKCSK
jgi:adenosylhomocysteine/aminodeoxyfutalosine nucleosidase